jgi:hypothetical protein
MFPNAKWCLSHWLISSQNDKGKYQPTGKGKEMLPFPSANIAFLVKMTRKSISRRERERTCFPTGNVAFPVG